MNTFIGGVLFCGILIILVLWKYSVRSNPNNKMLALSLLFLCYVLIINHFVFTGYIFKVPHLIRTAGLLGNMIFPLLYVFVRNSFYPGKLWTRRDWWLLTPSVFYFIDMFPFFILSAQEKVRMLKPIFVNNHARWRLDKGQGWLCPQWFHLLIIYGLATFFWVLIVKMILQNQKMVGERISKSNKPLFRMLVMLAASYFIITVPGLLGTLFNVSWFNVYFLLFSLSITLIVVAISLAFSPQVLYGFVYQPSLLNEASTQKTLLTDTALLKVNHEKEKIYSNAIAPVKQQEFDGKLEMEALFLQIDEFMKDKKPFIKQNLSIHELATEIGLPVYAISKAINLVKGINYNKWLSQYRIAYFIVLYQDPANQQLTLEALAQKVGFISRITFIKNFKSEMGITPSQYIKTYYKKEIG